MAVKRTGGLILCGGQSSRMGVNKSLLSLGEETVLQRALANMSGAADPVVVALAPGGTLPSLPDGVLVSRDDQPEKGPLWGLAAGFRTLAGKAERIVVMPVDMPFFGTTWIARLVDGLEEHRVCMYRWQNVNNALTAAYDMALLPKVERLIAEGRGRPMAISDGEPTRLLTVEELWREGEGPPPMMDIDTPGDYRRALLLEGIGNPHGAPITVEAQPHDPSYGATLEAPLFAATAGEALALFLRLYPERRDAAETTGTSPRLLHVGADGRASPLRPDAPLEEGDRLRIADHSQGGGREVRGEH